MKARIILGLTSLLLWLPELFTISGRHKTSGIIVLLFILLSYLLFKGNKRAFRVYRGIFWVFLIIAVIGLLLAMSGQVQMFRSSGMAIASTDWGYFFWMLSLLLYAGGILYYSEKDHVRAAYGVEPKKKNVSATYAAETRAENG